MEYITSWERKGIEIGYAQGIEKGKIEGKIEGELKGKLEQTLKLLAQRIGEVSATMRKRLGKLTASQLDDLAVSLSNIQTRTDLSKWLKERAATGRPAK